MLPRGAWSKCISIAIFDEKPEKPMCPLLNSLFDFMALF